MLRQKWMMAGALALMLVPLRAHAAKGSWRFDSSVGIAIPRGGFEYLANPGFVAGMGLDYLATKKLAIGFDGFYVRDSATDLYNARLSEQEGTPTTTKYSILQGGTHLKYQFLDATISPFALIGIGAYRTSEHMESAVYEGVGSHYNLGTRAGLGMTCRAGDNVAINVETTLHGVWTAFSWDTGFEATRIVTIQAGVSMGMGKPSD